MKHYRILEIKGKNKHYTIQYLKKIFLGLHFWKKLNNEKYNKYDDALEKVISILLPSDYDTTSFGYHYIDAYKIFKQMKKETKIK